MHFYRNLIIVNIFKELEFYELLKNPKLIVIIENLFMNKMGTMLTLSTSYPHFVISKKGVLANKVQLTLLNLIHSQIC